MGIKIDQFDVPVCNSFKPRLVHDQKCYTVNPNEFKEYINLEEDLSLSLFINYNEDREMDFQNNETITEDHVIRIETISNHFKK